MRGRASLGALWETVLTSAAALDLGWDVALWHGRLPIVDADAIAAAVQLCWLDDADFRAIRKRPTAVAGAMASRRLLRRLVVAAHAGCAPGEVVLQARCAECGETTHGRPSVVAASTVLHLSTSTVDDCFVIAVGTQPIGVDVERRSRASALSHRRLASSVPSWEILRAACAPRLEIVELWTALEALTKGLGVGITAPPQAVREGTARWQLQWREHSDDEVSCVATEGAGARISVIEADFGPADDRTRLFD